jgi:hypothetical protein
MKNLLPEIQIHYWFMWQHNFHFQNFVYISMLREENFKYTWFFSSSYLPTFFLLFFGGFIQLPHLCQLIYELLGLGCCCLILVHYKHMRSIEMAFVSSWASNSKRLKNFLKSMYLEIPTLNRLINMTINSSWSLPRH